jgi:PleD family two-component response regulator
VSDTDAAALAELMAPQAPLPEDETDAVAKAHRAPGCDVLIADDAGASRELLSAILRNFAGPLDIREARNGQDAVQLWQQLRPRITLLDIDMPDWTAWLRCSNCARSTPTPSSRWCRAAARSTT